MNVRAAVAKFIVLSSAMIGLLIIFSAIEGTY